MVSVRITNARSDLLIWIVKKVEKKIIYLKEKEKERRWDKRVRMAFLSIFEVKKTYKSLKKLKISFNFFKYRH